MSISFDQISDSIYLGSAFEPSDWHILSALGVTACLNLMEEMRDQFVGLNRPDVHMWLPVVDWSGPRVEELRLGTAYMDMVINQGRRIYVHCYAGVGRSPVMVAGYLVLKGMSADEALKLVQKKRPDTNPVSGQVNNLIRFAEYLKQG